MEKLLSIKDAAEILSVNPRTVNRMINRGELAAVKVGNRWRIKPEDVVRFSEVKMTALKKEAEEFLELLKKLEPDQKKQVRDCLMELAKKEENSGKV